MDSYNLRKTHESFGFMSKPSNENRVAFTPDPRRYGKFSSTPSGGHKTRPYAVEMGRGRKIGIPRTDEDARIVRFYVKTIKRNRVVFTPDLWRYGKFSSTLPGGHKTRPYQVDTNYEEDTKTIHKPLTKTGKVHKK